MDLLGFRDAFDQGLKEELQKNMKNMQGLLQHPEAFQFLKAAERMALAGGKRARPYMAEALYLALGGKKKAAVRKLGIGLELFHLFCLIHDDIIDEAALRHGVPAVHASTNGLVKTQTSQAILVGDLFFSWANACVVEAARMVDRKETVLPVFRGMVNDVVAGQMLDVALTGNARPKKKDVLRKNHLKTATYSFVRPLELGFTLAHGKKEVLPHVKAFGLALGSAFQIQDDLLDVCSDEKTLGKAVMTDVAAGVHTVLSVHLLEKGSAQDRATFQKYFGKGVLSARGREEVRAAFERSGACVYAQKRVAVLFAQGEKALQHPDVPEKVRAALLPIHTYLKNRHA